MYAGNIVSTHSLVALEKSGAGIQSLLAAAYRDSKISPDAEPIAVTCWSSMIMHPQLEPTRAAPIVVVGLPAIMAMDTKALAQSPLLLQVVEDLSWAQRLTCLELHGQTNTIKLRCDQLLPVMRMSAIGSILLILVCGDDVLFVEHDFDRRAFLDVCHELRQDMQANGEPDIDDDWRAARIVEKTEDKNAYLPLLYMLDDAEEFSYGVVRC